MASGGPGIAGPRVQGLLRGPRRPEDGVAGRHQEGLPQARPPAPSRRQARATRRPSGGSRRSTRPTRSSPTPTSASSTTSSAPNWEAISRARGPGRRRCAPGARSAGSVGGLGGRQRPLRVPHDRRSRRVLRLLPGLLRRRGSRPARPSGRAAAGGRPAARLRGHPRRAWASTAPLAAAAGRAGSRRARPRRRRRTRPPPRSPSTRPTTARRGWSRSRASGSRSRSRRAPTPAPGSG